MQYMRCSTILSTLNLERKKSVDSSFMNVFGLVSRIFPELCHICSNNCSCQVFGSNSVITSSKNRKRKVAADSDMNKVFGYGKSSKDASTSKAAKSSKISAEDVAAGIFAKYVDEEDPEMMYMDGIGGFCDALSIDATVDVRALVLMWRLGAGSKPGCITKEEFCKGFVAIGACSMENMITKCPSFDPGFLENTEFRDFYKFVFQFNREGTNKTIERDIIVALLPLVLDINKAPHLDEFLAYLDTIPVNTRITLDQWESFLLFNKNVQVDLSNYEEDGAWPILLDEYVDWKKGRQ